MKRILLSLGLISAMASAAMAETYTAPTTPMPEATVYTPTTASPGVYSELVGAYECNLTAYYQYLYSNNLFSSPTGWIVNEDDEIVYTGTVNPFGMGMRNGNCFRMQIAEADAIKEPGTYYFIWPACQNPEEPGQAMLFSDGSIVDVYNLKAGPYIVGEIGEPVEAQITVSPVGEFVQPEGVTYFTLTIENASILNAANLSNDVDNYEPTLTVTGPNGALTMEAGIKDGNTIKWEFPVSEDGENSAKLEGGLYKVTVNYGNMSAFTEALNPITFPDTQVTYEFTVEGDSFVTPEVALSPSAMEFESWTAATLGITLKGYKFSGTINELNSAIPRLIIVNPTGETYEPVGKARGLNAIGYTVSGFDFSIPGEYNCYWKIGGMKGINTSDNSEVTFKDLNFTYKNTSVVKYAPEVILVAPEATQEEVSSTILSVDMPTVVIQSVTTTKFPTITITKPSGEEWTTSKFRKNGTKYVYQLDAGVFNEVGIYKAVWYLDGWTAKVTVEGESEPELVELKDVEWTYEVTGTPKEPETTTDLGTEVKPTPGPCRKIDGIHITFGSDYIEDFGSWTENFSAEMSLTNLSDNTVVTYQPVLMNGGKTVAYDVKLSSDMPTTFKAAINLWKQEYNVATGARAAETATVPSDKAWIVVNYTLDKETGLEVISLDGDASELYYDLSGNRLPGKPEKGAYIRLSSGSAEKVIR